MRFSDAYNQIKSTETKQARGLDFVEARAIWNDPLSVSLAAKNVKGEARAATVGKIQGKLWVALWTVRPDGLRIISVHRAEGTPFERSYHAG